MDDNMNPNTPGSVPGAGNDVSQGQVSNAGVPGQQPDPTQPVQPPVEQPQVPPISEPVVPQPDSDNIPGQTPPTPTV